VEDGGRGGGAVNRSSKYFKFIPIVLLAIIIIIFLPRLKGLEVTDILEYSPESPLLAALILLGIYCLVCGAFIKVMERVYNNGLAEGSVNKLKVAKRIMYGRNSFQQIN